ncbi:MAG: hypothetical protein PHQ75_04575 [Thermoguttaceae bacterium]|nr:hypothetical protein [Thermoguttaceae bacterium]
MKKIFTRSLIILLVAAFCISLVVASGCSSTKSQKRNDETMETFLSKDKPSY